MYARLLAFVFAASIAQASNTLFTSGNVNTGNMWNAAENQGGGTSGSCTIGASPVQFFSAAFHTDTTSNDYSLHLFYESLQSGFVYLYQDAFNPLDPCNGIITFGFAPIANIASIHLDANRQYVFVTSENMLFGGGGSFQVTINGPAGSDLQFGLSNGHPAFCFGDGSQTACPCGNVSPVGAQSGCLNSLGMGGHVMDIGAASLANDTEVLRGSQMPDSTALYLQGTAQQPGGAGIAFGDGLRCAFGTVVRLGTKTNSGGASQYPGAADPSLSVRGGVTVPGSTRFYQIWYRNAASFCTTDTFNLTNGLTITWGS